MNVYKANASFTSCDSEYEELSVNVADAGEQGLFGAMVEDSLSKENAFKDIRNNDFKFTLDDEKGTFKTTIAMEDGNMYAKWEQHNVAEIAARCAEKRAFYQQHGTSTPICPHGFEAMDLPMAFAKDIEHKYFGGMSFDVIRKDHTMLNKFYQIVNRDYSAFVCHPSGKIPKITRAGGY